MDFPKNYWYNMDLAIPNKKDLFSFPVWDLHPKMFQASLENSRNNQARLEHMSERLQKR